jgi:hypothetical protein
MAACDVAKILWLAGERGFEMSGEAEDPWLSPTSSPNDSRIYEEVLNRLALIGDYTVVPTRMRKMASHCGGVPPVQGSLAAFTDTPMVADAGNALYASIVHRLLTLPRNATPLQLSRIEHIECFNDEHLADLVEANFAAADMANAIENGTTRSWATLVGGAHGHGDVVTAWLVRAVHWEVSRWSS